MPDWSYHPLKKIALSKMEAKNSRQFIHHSMRTIAAIPGGKHLIEFLGHNRTNPLLKQQVNGTHFNSPIGLSSKLDPQLTGVTAFQELGFNFIEIGPIVVKKPAVQLPPQWHDQHISFSHTEEKVLLKNVLKLVITKNIRIPLFARFDENLSKQELYTCITQLTPYVEGFFLYSDQIAQLDLDIGATLYQIVSVDSAKTIRQVPAIVRGFVIDAPITATKDHYSEHSNAFPLLQQAVQELKKSFPDYPIVTRGGVESPSQALCLKEYGTDLIMLSEGYVKTGPGLPKRIHERLLYEKEIHSSSQSWHWSFLFGLAILIGGLIAQYFALTTVILNYDENFIGLTHQQLNLINPQILAFMAHDRMSLAGTMISASILYMSLAYFGIRRQLHWAKVTFHSAAITGFLGILLFIGYGYFDWLHGLFWLLLLPLYALSWRESKTANRSPQSWHDTNDRIWMRGVYGQLLFVMLGFLLLAGGVVISFIGITKVFVSTDISFLCMPVEMLQSISDMLIPVIAHDRAGFGSALISVGILVLCLSLWGFRAGERWLWFTYAFGALPAFLAGIGTHFAIGYTAFIHLLPLYFLVVIYLLGLVVSYPYLMQQPEKN
ncbi:beta/alpha barrel domain-containing protein [Solibacillus ferritrahens]|uniref:dihydroorotate dehydrogenase n=1 Tax=Solibacillus ferritrahens TaxID=3098620 RepID=UPI00300BD153